MLRSIFYCCASIVILLSCENEPNYPVQPYIEIKSLEFRDSPKESGTDSLILTFKYRDGDQDLGLEDSDWSDPYHARNYYLASNGKVTPVTTFHVEAIPQFERIIDLDAIGGKLVTPNTRLKPGYDFLPPNEYPFSCTHYVHTTIYLTNRELLDETDNAYSIEEIPGFDIPVYKVMGTFYSTENPNYSNVEVDFFVEDVDGQFNEFSWETDIDPPNCGFDFNGRFPKTLETYTQQGPFEITKKNKYEGEITFNMASVGFQYLFANKKIKLRLKIRDRALNESNVVETTPLTLEELKE